MDDNFSIVKGAVSILDVWRQYGNGPMKYGFVICPFHSEKTPSMKLYEQRYKCFGCGESGDIFDLASGLLGISIKDALTQIAKDFNITTSLSGEISQAERLRINQERRRKAERKAKINTFMSVLCDYHRRLFFAKNNPDDPLFTEALREIDKVAWLLDELLDDPDAVMGGWQKYVDNLLWRLGEWISYPASEIMPAKCDIGSDKLIS